MSAARSAGVTGSPRPTEAGETDAPAPGMTIGSVVVSEPSNARADGVEEFWGDGFEDGLTSGVGDTVEGPVDPLAPPVPPRGNAFGVVTEPAAAPLGPSGFWFGSACGRAREGFAGGVA